MTDQDEEVETRVAREICAYVTQGVERGTRKPRPIASSPDQKDAQCQPAPWRSHHGGRRGADHRLNRDWTRTLPARRERRNVPRAGTHATRSCQPNESRAHLRRTRRDRGAKLQVRHGARALRLLLGRGQRFRDVRLTFDSLAQITEAAHLVVVGRIVGVQTGRIQTFESPPGESDTRWLRPDALRNCRHRRGPQRRGPVVDPGHDTHREHGLGVVG